MSCSHRIIIFALSKNRLSGNASQLRGSDAKFQPHLQVAHNYRKVLFSYDIFGRHRKNVITYLLLHLYLVQYRLSNGNSHELQT